METKDLGLAHLLVLANKADLDGALGPGELWDELRLGELASEQNRSRVTVLPICATSGQGCPEALDWFANEAKSCK